MKSRRLLARVALFVIGGWVVSNAQAASYLHLQHDDGRIGVWELDALRLKASLVYDPPSALDGNQLKGVHDFDGDGDVDLFFESDLRHIQLWQLESGTRVSSIDLGVLAEDEGLIWVGGWNGGPETDLLTMSGDRLINLRRWNEGDGMSNPSVVASVDAGYRLIAATDLDGDGLSDLLMSHHSGRIEAWLLGEDGEFKEIFEWDYDSKILTDWELVGAADLDGQAGVDVVLQHRKGSFAVWPLMFPEFLDLIVLSEAPDDVGWRVAVVDSAPDDPNFDDSAPENPVNQSPDPLDTSPIVNIGAVSFGNPDARTSPSVDQWWRQRGTPFLEIWVP